MLSILVLSIAASTFAESFITPAFRLHDPDSTLIRAVPRITADTLGNFYVSWREGVYEGVGADGSVVVTRIRHDGVVEKAFVTIASDSSQGYGFGIGIQVSPDGERIALAYSRFFDTPLEAKGVTTALPSHQYTFLQMLDSSGTHLLPELWADSQMQGRDANSETVLMTGETFAAVWRTESVQVEGAYLQAYDVLGNRVAARLRVDTCADMTCLGGQHVRSDSHASRSILTWDEAVLELGGQEQRPVFRLLDSLANAVSAVIPGAYEPGYVADCGASAAGYQSGYAPDVAIADDGEFMLIWSSCDGLDFDPFGGKPWGQIYHADGTPKTGLILLADTPPHDAVDCKVAWGSDGNYYAAWADARNACPQCLYPLNVFVQRISPDGALLGHNYIINDVLDAVSQGFDVDIAVSKGRACIVWRDKRNKYDSLSPAPYGEFFARVVSLDLIGTYVHGDVNLDYQFTTSDIIYLVNYVFKSGQRPLPGSTYGDVNGDCIITAADIIYYVNFVFRGGTGFKEACSVQ